MKIYDCITYLNEDRLLDLRFNILDDFVDFFVICEAKEDHRGKKKNLNFKIDRYLKFKDKIIYLVVENFENCKKTWDRQDYQRNYLLNGLKDSKLDDIIMFSDVDEIPNLSNIDKNLPEDTVGIFDQKVFYYKLNLQVLDYNQWEGTRICRKKNLKSFTWLRNNIRLKNLKYSFWRIDKFRKVYKIDNGGWHFSFLGSPEHISSKIKSYAHEEFDLEQFTNIKNIQNNIDNLIDKFNRNKKLKKIDLNNSFPKYILENKNKLSDLIY